MDRREFLQMLGIFSGASVLSSCGGEEGQKKLISYLVPPEDGVLPGEARWVPGTCTECPAGCGLLVRVREGSPVKLEGVPGHPVSDGGLCVRGQASLWRLYHPERVAAPLLKEEGGARRAISWEEAYALVASAMEDARSAGKRNVYLSGRTTGTLAELVDRFCSSLGVDRLPEFEFYSHAALRRGHGILFSRKELPLYRFEDADLLVTLGPDLLETFVSPVYFAGQFARARQRGSLRWLHAEPHVSLTGLNADERLVVRPGSEAPLLAFVLRRLAAGGRLRQNLPEAILRTLPELPAAEASSRTGIDPKGLEGLVDSIGKAENPLLIAGGVATGQEEGTTVAVLAGLLQWVFGMTGRGVDFNRSENYSRLGDLADTGRLAGRMGAGEVGVAFVSRANPLYDLPASLGFADALERAAFRVGFCDVLDETARELDLVLPLSHSLESWGDSVPRNGVRTLIRPAVEPLHDSRTEGDILLDLLRRAGERPSAESYQEFLFSAWRSRHGEEALKDFSSRGYLEEKVPEDPVRLDVEGTLAFLQGMSLGKEPASGPMAVVVPSIRKFDGRSRPLALLSEIPDPLSTITYGRWVSMGPEEAQRRNIVDGDEVRLTVPGWSALLAAKIQPGLPAGVFLLQRDVLEAAPLLAGERTGEANAFLGGVRIEKTGAPGGAPILAGSTSQQGRGILPEPGHGHERKKRRFSLYPEHEHGEYRWAMAIDLRLCIGCGACAAACYIENNVPVVGPKDHLAGREMSWLRIEPFYDERGGAEFVPMLCQHCHYAPCEPVCPVYAAYHNPEGLNVQVYNRCVGTRYCSNNCPYKVRRFNWWDHRPEKPLERMYNPDLSVRSRGMMEKCTFCIQRIRAARDRAKDEGRKIRDGEAVTACAQSCPTGAIVFGNLLDENSRVSRLAGTSGSYRVFEELGTEPSVYYLKKR